MKKKTVSEIYREWRNVKRHLVKESSFATYSINIERHILPAFGNCRTVDNDDAQALAFRLAADGLSANTVKGVMLVLRMLLEFGWRHGWAERPDLRVNIPKEAAQRHRLPVLGIDDQRAVMSYISANRTYENPVVYSFTGLNEVKPAMIEEATKNARISAEKFATDSQSRLGKIKTANQGQISISNRDENSPHIKTLRVVTTINYYLKD